MTSALYLIKYNLIKQVRSYRFLLIIATSILLGYLCVPSSADGYQIFYIGGVRGVYNSAWLGAMGALLPIILLWLPGFYLLRSQISENKRLKIGQIIASTPLSKLRYVAGEAISNFAVLIVLEVTFLLSLIVMQWFRGESMEIVLWQYTDPMLVQTIPYLLVLAALTVLFDVVPGIRGAFGNILIFMLWVTLTTVSVAAPGNPFDLFGIGTTLSEMVQGAKKYYPDISAGSGSFGYYPEENTTPTFIWSGMEWSSNFLISRLLWIGVAILMIIIASLMFNRFRDHVKDGLPDIKVGQLGNRVEMSTSSFSKTLMLSPVKQSKRVHLLRLIHGELRIMVTGIPKVWYLAWISGVAISLLVPYGENYKWIALILLLPISIWSQMGCREKYYFTKELIYSSCPLYIERLASWAAGVMIALAMSSGVLFRFILLSEWGHFVAWGVGSVFIPTLALTMGSLSGSRRLFEGIYIAWFYVGPLNSLGKFDFLGQFTNNTLLYLLITCVLLMLGIVLSWVKERHILK